MHPETGNLACSIPIRYFMYFYSSQYYYTAPLFFRLNAAIKDTIIRIKTWQLGFLARKSRSIRRIVFFTSSPSPQLFQPDWPIWYEFMPKHQGRTSKEQPIRFQSRYHVFVSSHVYATLRLKCQCQQPRLAKQVQHPPAP